MTQLLQIETRRSGIMRHDDRCHSQGGADPFQNLVNGGNGVGVLLAVG
jgi:hypothetical protein